MFLNCWTKNKEGKSDCSFKAETPQMNPAMPSRFMSKVSVQGVVALGGHFATFCQELDF